MIRRMASGLATQMTRVLTRIAQSLRWAYNFDGVDDRGQLSFRAINPDGDNTFEFWSPENFSVFRTIVSQSISSTIAAREFGIFCGNTGLGVNFGGVETNIMSLAEGFKPNTRYGLTLTGTNAQIFEGGLNGALVKTASFVRGAAREPSAATLIGCRANNAGVFANFFQGIQRDVRINGVLYPMNSRNQSVLIPSPSGLGTELITQSVLGSPFAKGSQWTYLGGGRWQYIGDGSFNELTFIASGSQPEAGFLEFEVESISGQMRCYSNTSGVGTLQSPLTFSTTGVFRYFYTNKSALGGNSQYCTFIRANSGLAASCIIKNISFKPLWVTNAAELVTNGNFASGSTGWNTAASASLSVSGGQATITTVAVQPSRIEQTLTLEANRYYQVQYDLISLSGNTATRLMIARGAAGSYAQIANSGFVSSTGRISLTFLAPATDALLQIRGDETNAGTLVVDNVSLRRLDSLCNPMTLSNTTSDRWTEIEE